MSLMTVFFNYYELIIRYYNKMKKKYYLRIFTSIRNDILIEIIVYDAVFATHRVYTCISAFFV